MSRIFFLAMFFFTFTVRAGTSPTSTGVYSTSCNVMKYICLPGFTKECVWLTGGARLVSFELEKNPSYPNPNYPNEVWKGEFSEDLYFGQDKANYKIEVTALVSPDGKTNFNTNMYYTWNDLIGYAEGANYLTSGVIEKELIGSQSKIVGRGQVCHEPSLVTP